MKNNRKLLAGVVATIPMTFVMMELFKQLPRREKYPLPPRIISMNLAEDLGIKDNLTEKGKLDFTLINHFAYGAMAAAFYFPLAKKIKINNQISGIAYGLSVWAFSYLGLLPKLNLYPKISSEPAERNLLMIFSHIVWGSSLGLIKTMSDLLKGDRKLRHV